MVVSVPGVGAGAGAPPRRWVLLGVAVAVAVARVVVVEVVGVVFARVEVVVPVVERVEVDVTADAVFKSHIYRVAHVGPPVFGGRGRGGGAPRLGVTGGTGAWSNGRRTCPPNGPPVRRGRAPPPPRRGRAPPRVGRGRALR